MVGTLYGTLELQATATALVVGWQKGGVVVAGGVDPGGRLKGAVDNSGLLTVRGTVEGLRRGTGEVRIERGGLVRGPAT